MGKWSHRGDTDLDNFLIFGGTTEGRLLAEYCDKSGIYCTVSVATEYGAELLPKSDNISIETGRKDRGEIADFIASRGFAAVFDAAHPYAEELRKNITGACGDTETAYYRVIREPSAVCDDALYFDTAAMAAEYACRSEGRIFIATGSKELPLFMKNGLPERCVVRVLPDDEILRQCREAGFSKIISGKGPFSFEENVTDFEGCRFVITKESGSTGGFEEKRRGALAVGAKLLIIKRPAEKGMNLSEAEKLIAELAEKK